MSKVLVFDFDGTIADSNNVIFDVLDEFIPSLTREVYIQEMRNFYLHRTWRQILKALFLEFTVKSKKEIINQEINSKILNAKVFLQIEETLRQLKSNGNILIILSSNFKDNINEFLVKNNLDFFDEVTGSGHVLSKYKHLREIAKKYSGKEIFYIGDELRDIDTARKAKVEEVAVTWGINSRKDFEEFNAKRILEKVQELLEL